MGTGRFARYAALTCALLALVIVPSASGTNPTQPCGWLFRLSGDQVNLAFPDAAARYWVAQLPLPPGFHVEISGRFPHARYISFVTYDPATRSVDGIHDAQIVPNHGSTNPFTPGARRTVTRRSYTVYLRNEAVPATRAPNTLYTDNGKPLPQTKRPQPTDMTTLVYRVYEPDQGRDVEGGEPLPALSIVSDSGTQRETLPSCPADSLPSTQSLTTGLAGAGAGSSSANTPPTELGGQNPPVWLKYTNAPNGVGNGVLNNPRLGPLWPPYQRATNMLPSGGFWDNPDNAYITTFDSSAYGDVLVFHGKAPTTPQTYLRKDTRMGSGQVRYWSMCSNMSTTQYLGCVKDDDVRLDRRGYYTIVISTRAARPAEASARCGIEWLPKGALPSAPIILRNMLPAASFRQAVQDIPAQGDERATMGPYYPAGRYFQHPSEFDTFVKTHGGCTHFAWP